MDRQTDRAILIPSVSYDEYIPSFYRFIIRRGYCKDKLTGLN